MRSQRPMYDRRAHVAAVLAVMLVWCASVPKAHSQLLVFDAANAVQNTITAVESTLTTIESVLQTGMMVLELTGFDDYVLDGTFLEDLDELAGMIDDASSIGRDINSIMRQVTVLFDLDTAPNSAAALAERTREIRYALYEVNTTAIRVQTLIRTTVRTVQRIKKLVDRIQAFVGQKQALQNINESISTLTKIEANHHATTAAFQRAMTMQAMEAPLIQESLPRIKEQFCGRWCQ